MVPKRIQVDVNICERVLLALPFSSSITNPENATEPRVQLVDVAHDLLLRHEDVVQGLVDLERSVGLPLGIKHGHEQRHKAQEHEKVAVAAVALLLPDVADVQLPDDLLALPESCSAVRCQLSVTLTLRTNMFAAWSFALGWDLALRFTAWRLDWSLCLPFAKRQPAPPAPKSHTHACCLLPSLERTCGHAQCASSPGSCPPTPVQELRRRRPRQQLPPGQQVLRQLSHQMVGDEGPPRLSQSLRTCQILCWGNLYLLHL